MLAKMIVTVGATSRRDMTSHCGQSCIFSIGQVVRSVKRDVILFTEISF